MLSIGAGVAMAADNPFQTTANANFQSTGQPLAIPVIGYGHYKNRKLNSLPKRTYRVLVGKGYPPFNYRDATGKITGFNVEIARALCQELNFSCQIVAKNWQSIQTDLNQGKADFAVASLAISRKNLLQFEMTQKYYDTPARFIIRKNNPFNAGDLSQLNNKNIGVVANSGHEAYALRFFTEANIYSYPNLTDALDKLVTGKVMTVFADAITAKYWLEGENSFKCCKFTGNDFYETRFFGQGGGVALPKGEFLLRDWLNDSLHKLWSTGRYEEIFKQFF